jgi:peptide/nickel transport system substrate-binding protein
MRFGPTLLLLCAASGLAPVPRSQTPAPSAVPQGHVLTGVAEEPEDVNPFTAHSIVAQRWVLAFTHDTLLENDPRTGVLRPALAAAFERSEDGRACTFTLREGVRFSDGSPLSMDDVLFGWELARSGHVTLGYVDDAFARVEDVEVLDAKRLRVKFRDLHYAAVEAVGTFWIVAQRAFFVERVGELAKRAGLDVPEPASASFCELLAQIDLECGPGTGPYALRNPPEGGGTWRPRQDLLLERNPHCWRRDAEPGTWNLDGIRLLFRDSTSAYTALLNGELDWYSSSLVDDVLSSRPQLADSYRKVVYDYRTLGVYRIVWNCRRPGLGDARVRRALGMLFDLDAVLAVFGHNGAKAKAFAKPDSPEYPRDVPRLPSNVPGARRLLREAGFDAEEHRLRIVLLVPQGPDTIRRTLDLFADAARNAGVDLEVRVREWAAFIADKKTGDWDGLFVLQAFRPWGDPFDFVHTEGSDNEGGWSNAEADRLAEAARIEFDQERRTKLLRELHELVYREQPTAFLVHPVAAILLNKHVQAAEPGPLGLCIDRAWVAPEFQRR